MPDACVINKQIARADIVRSPVNDKAALAADDIDNLGVGVIMLSKPPLGLVFNNTCVQQRRELFKKFRGVVFLVGNIKMLISHSGHLSFAIFLFCLSGIYTVSNMSVLSRKKAELRMVLLSANR
ncbi:hypothetical protein SDC9_184883 [bioreactor metagenome]|uniref:Uncharacterized protein n=1 Tax=bioreactor metagenome TaxID=1076179 RepID=A0A645HFL9_9ZZZZ